MDRGDITREDIVIVLVYVLLFVMASILIIITKEMMDTREREAIGTEITNKENSRKNE